MVENIFETIRQDIIINQSDLYNMQHYYTHKFRSNNRLLDINVGIFQDNRHYITVQIYVADKNVKIRERMKLINNTIVDTDIIIKRN